MINNVLIALSCGAILGVLFEIFASDKQKASVSDAFISGWAFADRLKNVCSFVWERRQRWRLVSLLIVIPVVICVMSFFYFTRTPQESDHAHIFLAIIGIPAIVCGLAAARFVFNAVSLPRALFRCSFVLVILFVPLYSFLLFTEAHSSELKAVGDPTPFQLGWLLVLVFAMLFASAVFCVWLLLALPLITFFAFQLALFCGEFLLRRLAEYPKGPVVAISLLIGGLAAFLKGFAAP